MTIMLFPSRRCGFLKPVLFAVASLVAGLSGSVAAACPNWSLTGQQISYTSDQLWVPQSHSVIAGGPNNLNTCSQPGTGYVATSPDFDLNFSRNGMGRDLEIRVNASCDSVLLVNAANGQWFFDDDGGEGLNSTLRIPNAPEGVYDIWIGTYGPSTCNATMTLETFGGGAPGGTVTPPPPPQALCPNPGMNGQMITFDGQGLWVPQNFPVVAGGNVDLGACAAVPGHGNIIQNPDFTLNFTANPQNYALEFRVDGTCDPVLLVNDSNGRWHYNDDADGFNSRLRIEGARPGLFDIWVGTYGNANCNATLTAETFPAQVVQPPPPPPPSAICPDPGMNGQMITFDGPGLWAPQSFPIVAGGNVDLRACTAVPGHGHIIQNPDFTLNFTANPRNYDLELRVDGACDTVLLVNDANGQWHFNDDGGEGLNALLRLPTARPGQYDIWVGTYGNTTCNATLIAETFQGQGGGGQQPGVEPAPANMTGYRGQNGQVFTFQVTGSDTGAVWGSGIYTDDSNIARAAVHAGLVQVGQTATVQVQVLPGQQSYQGSAQNGVQSSNYGSWSGSYQFLMAGGGGGGGGQMSPIVGAWSINANGWTGTLDLSQQGGGWSGTVHFDAHGRTEVLQDVRYDAASGMVTFTRPISGATQMYRGTVAGDQISGQFNQGGGAFGYTWTATRVGSGPDAAARPAAPAPGGGGQGK